MTLIVLGQYHVHYCTSVTLSCSHYNYNHTVSAECYVLYCAIAACS